MGAQKYGKLNKTSTMIAPADIPRNMVEISKRASLS